MHESKQKYELIRSESNTLEKAQREESNDITTHTLDDIERLEQEFKKLVNEDKQENSFLKQQLSALTQDRMKLDQNMMILNTRVCHVEQHVGVELTLPKIGQSSR